MINFRINLYIFCWMSLLILIFNLFISSAHIYASSDNNSNNSSNISTITPTPSSEENAKVVKLEATINLQSKKSSKSETDNKTALNVYLIALAVLGLFSMYNALEIYKKKGEFDKESIQMINKYQEKFVEQERRHIELMSSSHDTYNELLNKIDDIDARIVDFVSNLETIKTEYESHIDTLSDLMTKKYGEIETYVNKLNYNYESHVYLSHLYSLIPDFIMDDRNRRKIFSAVSWFSQNGTHEDLKVLEERRTKINADDKEMLKLFDGRIKELKRHLSSNSKIAVEQGN